MRKRLIVVVLGVAVVVAVAVVAAGVSVAVVVAAAVVVAVALAGAAAVGRGPQSAGYVFGVGQLNNVTDAHFGSQSFVAQQFRVGELKISTAAESLSSEIPSVAGSNT